MKRRDFLKALTAVAMAPVILPRMSVPRMAPAVPKGLAYVVNNDTDLYGSISRVSYPLLRCKLPVAHDGLITRESVEKLAKSAGLNGHEQ